MRPAAIRPLLRHEFAGRCLYLVSFRGRPNQAENAEGVIIASPRLGREKIGTGARNFGLQLARQRRDELELDSPRGQRGVGDAVLRAERRTRIYPVI